MAQDSRPTTTLLRNDASAITDCWFSDGSLVIRQTKFNSEGLNPEAKIVCLSPEEQKGLLMLVLGTAYNLRSLTAA
jgi:hypothetical protein